MVIAQLIAKSSMFLWSAIPIVAAISLVYGATRHELIGPIFYGAYRTAVWIIGFVAAIAVVLAAVSWFV